MSELKAPVKPARRKPVPAAIPDGATPAAFQPADVAAIQALAQGVANDGQQKRALTWILNSACMQGLWAYSADARTTDIALGRQFVAQQIVGLIRIPLSKVDRIALNEERGHG